MTTNVLFIQGAGRGAHEEDRSIADELQRALGEGFRLQFPRMPGEDDPKLDTWKRAIALEAQHGRADIVVAHSAGAAMLADLLAEGRGDVDLPRVRAVFLLAPPYVGEEGWDFTGFNLDAQRDRPRELDLALSFYFGDDDETVPADHAALYRKVFPGAAFTRLSDCDHQFSEHVAHVARDVEAAAQP